MNIYELVEVYADAWTKLDASLIKPFLSNDYTYSSMWVFETLDKNGYLEYLQGKFHTIKKTGSQIKVSTGKNKMGIPSVILCQDGIRPAYITVKESNGLIVEAYMMAY